MKPSAARQLRLRIQGRVQGVGFRMFVLDEARALGLTGWVRNLPGGDVETVAEGSPALLTEFQRRCQEGPPMSFVRDLEATEAPATGYFPDFRIEY